MAKPKAPDPSGGTGNSAVADIIKKKNQPTGPRDADPNKTGIVHFGLNKHAGAEVSALNKANRKDGGAVGVKNQGGENTFVDGKTTYDLSTPAGAAEFTSTLGLPDAQAIAVAKFLGQKVGPESGLGAAKDELAQLVKVLAEAETGERELSRLVLSGHSTGESIWGDGNGEVTFEQLQKLVKIFPNAQKAVQHLMLSACSSGGDLAHDKYRRMFPNLQSSAGYLGSSPGTHSGALPHLKRWESATERGKSPDGVDADLAAKTRKGQNFSTWNKTDGYQFNPDASRADDLIEYDTFNGYQRQGYMDGEVDIRNRRNHNVLRAQYDRAQRISQDGSNDEATRTEAKDEADRLIRLLHYDDIKGKYMEANGEELTALYAKTGQKMPDFARMSRKEMTSHINTMVESLPKTADGQYDSDNFTDADWNRYEAMAKASELYDLDKSAIPNAWL